MTEKEIFEEIRICRKKVRQLQREIMSETDKTIAISKIDEMVQTANRISVLETLRKKRLSDDFKSIFYKILFER